MYSHAFKCTVKYCPFQTFFIDSCKSIRSNNNSVGRNPENQGILGKGKSVTPLCILHLLTDIPMIQFNNVISFPELLLIGLK